MVANQVQRRKLELGSQWQHIQSYIDSTEYLTNTRLDHLTEEVSSALKEAEKRESEFNTTLSQNPTDEQLSRVYPPLVKQLDAVQGRIEDIQRALLYLELNHYQTNTYSERLKYVNELCTELTTVLQLDVEILPVIWDGYAIYDIQRGDFYAIHLPRDTSPVHGAPIIGHEFGHILVDQLNQNDHEPFRKRLQEFLTEWPESRQPLVRNAWREWFNELACDACGLFTFGPAYLLAMVERLIHRNPYEIPRTIRNEHPPDALRFEFVKTLAEDIFSSEMYEFTEPARETYRDHLRVAVSRVPPAYDDWIDQPLLDAVEHATRSQLSPDLEPLDAALQRDMEPDLSENHELRIEANRYWLDRQNGG